MNLLEAFPDADTQPGSIEYVFARALHRLINGDSDPPLDVELTALQRQKLQQDMLQPLLTMIDLFIQLGNTPREMADAWFSCLAQMLATSIAKLPRMHVLVLGVLPYEVIDEELQAQIVQKMAKELDQPIDSEEVQDSAHGQLTSVYRDTLVGEEAKISPRLAMLLQITLQHYINWRLDAPEAATATVSDTPPQ